MIKTTMCTHCSKCGKSVSLYEEIIDKNKKNYYCSGCGKCVRTVITPTGD